MLSTGPTVHQFYLRQMMLYIPLNMTIFDLLTLSGSCYLDHEEQRRNQEIEQRQPGDNGSQKMALAKVQDDRGDQGEQDNPWKALDRQGRAIGEQEISRVRLKPKQIVGLEAAPEALVDDERDEGAYTAE